MLQLQQPSEEMLRLRGMLDEAGIAWRDDSDEELCRTVGDGFSVIYGPWSYGFPEYLEVWTDAMRRRHDDPFGWMNAYGAMDLIREVA